MNVELAQPLGFDPFDAFRLGARCERAVDWLSTETDRELLSDLAVVVRDDMSRIGIDADQSGHLDRYASLFSHLAGDGANDRFAYVLGAARDRPEAVVRALD